MGSAAASRGRGHPTPQQALRTPRRWRAWRERGAPARVRWSWLFIPEGREVVAAHGLRAWRDPAVVVVVEGVAVAPVVADRRPRLVREGAAAHGRPRRALVEIDAGDRAVEAAVLDHVAGARRAAAPLRAGPFGQEPDSHVRADPQAPERAVTGEVLDADAGGRPVDVDVLEARAADGGPRPEPAPCTHARAHAAQRSRVADPDARLGPAVRRAGLRPRDAGDVDVGDLERLARPRPRGLVGVDEHARVGEPAGHETTDPQPVRAPDGDTGPQGGATLDRRVEDLRAPAGAPYRDGG